MQQHLSTRRLWLLIRSDFRASRRSLAMISGIAAGLVLLLSLQEQVYAFENNSFHREMFGYALYIWGIWSTSRAFRPLHDKTRKEAYLLLPASALEKTLARLLAVTALLVILLLAYYTLLSLAIESLNFAYFGDRRAFFNPFDPVVWELIAGYIVLQAPYFLGAAWFRRAPFITTTLYLVLLLVGIAALAMAVLTIAFDGFGLQIWDVLYAIAGFRFGNREILEPIFAVFLALLPPALWFIAWLRLKEAQADDGI